MNSDLYIQQDRLDLLHSVPRGLNECFHCKAKLKGGGVGGGKRKKDRLKIIVEISASYLASFYRIMWSCLRCGPKASKKKGLPLLCFYANELACVCKREADSELTSEV